MKKLLCVLLACICLLSLGGCHGSKGLPAFAIPEDFDDSKTYTISFWAKNDTNLTQVAIYEQTIEEFEKIYPNIRVNLRLYTDYGRIYNDVITNISTNTTPNVCITYPDHIATYLTGTNTVIPLDELRTDARYGLGGSEVRFDSPTNDEMISKFLDECKLNGRYYALPYMRSSEACYVNKDMVEALGYTLPETLTWEFIYEVSREAVSRKNEDGTYVANGKSVLLPFIYKSTDNMMIQLLEQNGAGYSTEDGDIEIFNDTTREILNELYSLAKDDAFSTFKIVSYPGNFLNRGQCIFAIDSTAGATWMGADAPLIDIPEEDLVDFETVVMTVPQVDAENPKMISQGPSMCLFNKADKGEVLASWLFMQYLLTNSVQIPYSQTEGYVPVTAKAQNSAEYLDYLSRSGEDNDLYYSIKIDAAKIVLENTDSTFVTPVFNGSANLRNAAGQMIEEVCKSADRNETVDGLYIDALFREMTTLYRLEREINEMPIGSVVLLASIFTVDAAIIGYLVAKTLKKRKK